MKAVVRLCNECKGNVATYFNKASLNKLCVCVLRLAALESLRHRTACGCEIFVKRATNCANDYSGRYVSQEAMNGTTSCRAPAHELNALLHRQYRGFG